MIRFFTAIASIVLLCFSVSCKKEEKTDDNRIQQKTDSVINGKNLESTAAVNYEKRLHRLISIQNDIVNNPEKKLYLDSLYSISFNPDSSSFLVAGRGVNNPEFPEAAREKARERASKISAQKWALYLKEIHAGENVNYGEELEGKISYSKLLYREELNDTLYTLYQIPVFSVIIN